MINDHPFLSQLIEKHKKALENGSKDVRFNIVDLNNIVIDLYSLVAKVSERIDDNKDIKDLMCTLIQELRSITDNIDDGGKF